MKGKALISTLRRLPPLYFVLLGTLLLSTLSSCNIIAFPIYALSADKLKKVEPEFGDLTGKRVCIWIWTDNSILFEYPFIRLDMANYIKKYLTQNVDCEVVDPEEVESFREKEEYSEVTPLVKIARYFNADYLLFIQIFDFETNPIGAPHLSQGYINAEAALYDAKDDNISIESPRRRVWVGRISLKYPKDRAVPISDLTKANTISKLLDTFAERLAEKFYTHYEPVEQ